MSTPSQNPFEPSPPAGASPQGGAYAAPAAPPAGSPVAPPPAGAAYPAAFPAAAPGTFPASPPPAGPQFAAPYAPTVLPQYCITIDAPLPERGSALGRVALVLSLVAAVVLPILAAFAVWPVGTAWARAAATLLSDVEPSHAFDDLAWATPVADQVLWGELSLYAATGLGIAALVLGIMAIAQRRGRGAGIGAVVVAALGPFLFAGGVFVAFIGGSAAAITS